MRVPRRGCSGSPVTSSRARSATPPSGAISAPASASTRPPMSVRRRDEWLVGFDEDLATALADLPDQQRAVIEMRVLDGRPYAEVAEGLAITRRCRPGSSSPRARRPPSDTRRGPRRARPVTVHVRPTRGDHPMTTPNSGADLIRLGGRARGRRRTEPDIGTPATNWPHRDRSRRPDRARRRHSRATACSRRARSPPACRPGQ